MADSRVQRIDFCGGIADGAMGWPNRPAPHTIGWSSPYALHVYQLVGYQLQELEWPIGVTQYISIAKYLPLRPVIAREPKHKVMLNLYHAPGYDATTQGVSQMEIST